MNGVSAICLFMSHFCAFMLGMYAASQFQFGEPIDPYRWLVMIILFCFFGILSEVFAQNPTGGMRG